MYCAYDLFDAFHLSVESPTRGTARPMSDATINATRRDFAKFNATGRSTVLLVAFSRRQAMGRAGQPPGVLPSKGIIVHGPPEPAY
jgi:hypothetical protein